MRAALAGLVLSLLAVAAFLAFGRSGRRDGVAMAENQPASAPSTAPRVEEMSAPAEGGLSIPPWPGPPGEAQRAVVVELAPADDGDGDQEAPTELALRIVDAGGAPRPGLELDVELGDGSRSSWIAHTDGAGRLLVLLSAERRAEAPRSLRLRAREPNGLGARLPLVEGLGPGRTDLGDVALARVPVLVSGLVLSPSGAPCEKANLEIWTYDALGAFVDRRRVQTAPDGSFEVLDWAQGLGWLELSVRHGSGVSVIDRRVAAGAAGIVIALEEGGTLSGRVLVDDADALAHLRFHLLSDESKVQIPVRMGGELVTGRVEAGRYSLQLMLAGHPEPLARIESLVLADGAVTAPAELNPLDLRGRLRAINLRVEDEHGRRGTMIQVRYRSAGAGEDAWVSQAHRVMAPLKLHTAAAALDVEVASEGSRNAVLIGVDEDIRVDLLPGHPVVLVPRDAPRLSGECKLAVHLRPVDAFAGTESSSSFADRARFAAPVPGEYTVRVELVQRGGPVDLVCTPRSIRVQALEQEQLFVIALDQAQLDVVKRCP